MFYLDHDDWFIEVTDERAAAAAAAAAGKIGIDKLKSGDILSFGTIRDSIKPRFKLANLRSKYSEASDVMTKRIQILGQKYCGWRPIRGDGNCYYRAVLYSLLEQAVVNNNKRRREIFQHLHDLFAQIQFSLTSVTYFNNNTVM